MSRKVITANRLSDGRVVYLRAPADPASPSPSAGFAAASWVDSIAAATPLDDADAEARLTAIAKDAEARCVVLNPYAIELAGDSARAATLRERIRAHGPTVPPFQR
jgi:hypothetical protein